MGPVGSLEVSPPFDVFTSDVEARVAVDAVDASNVSLAADSSVALAGDDGVVE